MKPPIRPACSIDTIYEAMRVANTRRLSAFDRIAVKDVAIFADVPRRDDEPATAAVDGTPPVALFGVPIVIDETLEPGVAELRLGDHVVSMHRLA